VEVRRLIFEVRMWDVWQKGTIVTKYKQSCYVRTLPYLFVPPSTPDLCCDLWQAGHEFVCYVVHVTSFSQQGVPSFISVVCFNGELSQGRHCRPRIKAQDARAIVETFVSPP